MRLLTLAALSAILAVAAFNNGGSEVPAWHFCAMALGALGLAYVGYSVVHGAYRRGWNSALRGSTLALLGFALALCGLQLIPLPAAVLRILSPASWEIYHAAAEAGAAGGFTPLTPISVAPAATLDATLALLGCIVVFALVSDIAAQWSHGSAGSAREAGRMWRLAAPFLILGLLEAALGILQAAAGFRPGGATGTYQNHNHFAGLLEMCLPFTAMFAFAAWRRVMRREGVAWISILETCGGLAAVALMLLAVAASLSRMGFAATLAGLFAAGAAVLVSEPRTHGSGRRAWLALAAAAAVVLSLAALLPSTALIQRFDSAGGFGDISADARIGIWRDTLHLVRAFPLTGCGLGAFQSAYMRYQTVVPLLTVNFAHNDYLQLVAELGVVGFLALLMVAGGVFRALLRKLGEPRDAGDSYFYAACLGSLVAIALHSLVDFNLYKPANAMVVAWVAGMSAGRRGGL